MTTTDTPIVTKDAYLTLHYRLATLNGEDIITTFKESPATLQMGTGQLAPELELSLIGLAEGSPCHARAAAGKAFGP
jgi:FKBP-type peptidyl-prolyl cis-trans isomerase SlpA